MIPSCGLLDTVWVSVPHLTKRGFELTIASSFMRISIDDYLLKPAPT